MSFFSLPMRTATVAFFVLAMLSPSAFAEPTLGKNDQPIHDAARLGNAAEVERILRADPKQRDIRTGQGSTPLHLAATNPDSGPIQVLLKAGAEVNARDGEGATPLHLAAYTAKLKNTELLLQAGADVEVKTNAGRTPLSMARKMRSDEVAGVMSLWVLKGCKAGKPC